MENISVIWAYLLRKEPSSFRWFVRRPEHGIDPVVVEGLVDCAVYVALHPAASPGIFPTVHHGVSVWD